MVEKGKLYYETPCEHGERKPHRLRGVPPPPDEHGRIQRYCNGGRRKEVTIDYEATYDVLSDNVFNARWAFLDDVEKSYVDALAKDIVDAALVEGGNQ